MSDNVIYSKEFFIESTPENWDNRFLGQDEKFVRLAKEVDKEALNNALEDGKLYWEE